jgi:HlyD family secretion protein
VAVGLLVLTLSTVGIALWGRKGAGSTLRIGADLAEARVAGFEISITAVGELETARQVELRNELERQTTIVEIVPEGIQARAGDVLARLNADEVQRQIDEETLQVESARAQVVAAENAADIQRSENESRLRQARLKVDLADLALREWSEGTVATQREVNRIAIEKAERELARLEERLRNSEGLHQRGFLSKDELERDRTAVLEARAELTKARLAHSTYENYQLPKEERTRRSDLEEARAELERVSKTTESELASKLAALTNARNQLASREQRLSKLRELLDKATIRAPIDGLVVYTTSLRRWRWMGRSWSVGTQIFPGQEIIVLPDASSMLAIVRVHESLAGRIKPGLPAVVRIDALGGQAFPGTVESVGVLAQSDNWIDENNREYTVRIALADPPPTLKPSMRVEATIRLDAVPPTLTVPIQAVFMDGAVRFVYVSRGDRLARVPIRIGRQSDTLCEVTAGLSEGDRVLIRDPRPGEAILGPWDRTTLERVGYTFDDRGQPIDPLASAPQAEEPLGPPPTKPEDDSHATPETSARRGSP